MSVLNMLENLNMFQLKILKLYENFTGFIFSVMFFKTKTKQENPTIPIKL